MKNYVGVGLTDAMIQYSTHDVTHVVYPPYGFTNSEDYKNKQPRDCKKILYCLKANSTIQGDIDSTCFAELASGRVRFLIREQDAKTKMNSTQKGMNLPQELKIKKMQPYVLTTILIEEILNMRIKDGSVNQKNLTLERINTSMTKDKYSAFSYGLWRIKDYEDAWIKAQSRKNRDLGSFMLYSNRGGDSR